MPWALRRDLYIKCYYNSVKNQLKIEPWALGEIYIKFDDADGEGDNDDDDDGRDHRFLRFAYNYKPVYTFLILLLVKPMEKYKTRLSIGISTLTSFYTFSCKTDGKVYNSIKMFYTMIVKPWKSIKKYKKV